VKTPLSNFDGHDYHHRHGLGRDSPFRIVNDLSTIRQTGVDFRLTGQTPPEIPRCSFKSVTKTNSWSTSDSGMAAALAWIARSSWRELFDVKATADSSRIMISLKQAPECQCPTVT
jgi:hypothetical protein